MNPRSDICPEISSISPEAAASMLKVALVAESNTSPTFAQSLTRLHFLNLNLIPREEWAELDWLIREAEFFHKKRESRHRIFGFFKRRQHQRKVDAYFSRAAIRAAAIIRALEEHFLKLRGRKTAFIARNMTSAASQSRLPSWSTIQKAADRLNNEKSAETAAELIHQLVPMIDVLRLNTTIEPSEGGQDQDFEHLKWHAKEVTVLKLPRSWKTDWAHQKRINDLTLIAHEKALSLLKQIRGQLISLELGKTDNPEH